MISVRKLLFLVCNDEEMGRQQAREMGCTQIASWRFAHPDNHDLYIKRRFSDLPPGTPLSLMKGVDYDENPEKDRFDAFVAAGHGVWVE